MRIGVPQHAAQYFHRIGKNPLSDQPAKRRLANPEIGRSRLEALARGDCDARLSCFHGLRHLVVRAAIEQWECDLATINYVLFP